MFSLGVSEPPLTRYYLVNVFVFVLQECELKSLDNSAQIFNSLSDVPGDVQDVDELIEV